MVNPEPEVSAGGPMCLGPAFFDQREEAIKSREAAGEIEVEHFMRSKRLRFALLTELGYLDDRMDTPNTADLFGYRIPKKAMTFFSEDSDLQLIFVQASQTAHLASRLRNQVRAIDPEVP
jgi:hypothetical protein